MLEILAPAGRMEAVTAALYTGADAVYTGVRGAFSARANAVNLSRDELTETVKLCRLFGAKLYLAVNTLVFDEELDDVKELLEFAAETGVNAIITQDLAVHKIAAELDLVTHASTQMSVSSVKGAALAKELGFSRVVLARELSLEEIADINKNVDIETEVFIHGALCASVSGQCLQSAFLGGRSANRGCCAGPCRLNYRTSSGEHALSLKDLSFVEHISELAQAGVTSVKIEGRMKRAEYVAAAVSACVAARSGGEPDMQRLQSVFSRDGFTDGYLRGDLRNMGGVRTRDDVVSANEKLFAELRSLYAKPPQIHGIDFTLTARPGQKTVLTAVCGDISVTTSFPEPEEAKAHPVTEQMVATRLSKLGGTMFYVEKITCDIGEGVFLSAAALNNMRRTACCLITEKLS